MENKSLKKWREDRLMSFRDLAESSKVNASTIWMIENHRGKGKTYPSTKRKLCEALGVSPEQVLEFSESRPGVQTEAGE